MNLQHECKIVALRAYTKHSYMFPEGLLQLSSPDRAMANAPLHLRIEALRLQIEFLKSLHDTPISGPGVLQMDGASHGDIQPGCASGNITSQSPAGTAAAPAAAAAAAAAAPSQGRMLQQKGRQSNQGSNPASADWPLPNAAAVEAPPPPDSFVKGRHGAPNPGVTDAREYWNFCFRLLRSRGQAIGGMELAREFSAWQERSGHVVTRGHERWWERDRILHLQLFAAAGVKIRAGQTRLITSLKIFWKDFAGDLLDLLSAWLRSGAADAVSREALALSAVRHIRSERTKEAGSWWPHHGDALDVLCLTEGVVTEARLFEEWQASKAPDADQLTLFQKERATPKRLPIDTRRALAKTGRWWANQTHNGRCQRTLPLDSA